MLNKIVVSNIRFPHDEWIMLKTAASGYGMSANEYIRYLSQAETIKTATGIKKAKSKVTGYEAMDKFLNRKILDTPKGMSEEDEAIYGV